MSPSEDKFKRIRKKLKSSSKFTLQNQVESRFSLGFLNLDGLGLTIVPTQPKSTYMLGQYRKGRKVSPSMTISFFSLTSTIGKLTFDLSIIQAYKLYTNFGRYIVDNYEWSAFLAIMLIMVE